MYNITTHFELRNSMIPLILLKLQI